MSATAKLAVVESQTVARLDAQTLIEKAIAAGAGIETLERLVALAKDLRAVQAREAWHEAMAAFQRACPPIKKTSSAKIQTRGGGSYGYRFAALDEIMSTVTPVLTGLGLSMSWRSTIKASSVVVSCRVAHILGHIEDGGEVEMPITQSDTGANPAQRVGIALTYARRYSAMNVLGVSPEDDDDGGSFDVQHRAAPAGADDGSGDPLPAQENGAAIVVKVEQTEGKNAKTGKPWKRTRVTFADGRYGSTFSDALAAQASGALAAKVLLIPEFEESGGYINLIGLQAVGVVDEAGGALLKPEDDRDFYVGRVQALANELKLSAKDRAALKIQFLGSEDADLAAADIGSLANLYAHLSDRKSGRA